MSTHLKTLQRLKATPTPNDISWREITTLLKHLGYMETYTYKGYQGSVETSIEDGVLHGKIMFINDLVTYEATTLKALEKQFESAVNDYLASCKKLDKEPDKTLTGQFNVRVGEDLHRRIALNALQTDTSINAVVVAALTAYLNETRKTTKPIQRQRLVA